MFAMHAIPWPFVESSLSLLLLLLHWSDHVRDSIVHQPYVQNGLCGHLDNDGDGGLPGADFARRLAAEMKQGGGDVPPTASASSGVKFLDRRLGDGGLSGTDYPNNFQPSSLRKAEVVGDVEKQGRDLSLVVRNAIAAESVHTSVDVNHSVPRHLAGTNSFTDETIQDGVQMWINDQEGANDAYGHISTWNVSSVTNMEYLFGNASAFNQDISAWDVSSVTNVEYMF
jgi:surface protein